MARHLIVTQQFGGHVRGDRIDDAAEVRSVLASHPTSVVVVKGESEEAEPAPLAPPLAPAPPIEPTEETKPGPDKPASAKR